MIGSIPANIVALVIIVIVAMLMLGKVKKKILYVALCLGVIVLLNMVLPIFM